MKTLTWLRSLASRLVPAKRPRWSLDELADPDYRDDDIDARWEHIQKVTRELDADLDGLEPLQQGE